MNVFINILTPFAFGHLRLALVVSHKNPDGKRASTEQTHVIIRLNNKNNNKSKFIIVIHIVSPWGHLRKVSCVGAIPRGNVRVTTARVLQRTFVNETKLAMDLSFITFNDHHLHRLLDLQAQMLNLARGSGDVGFHWGSKHRLASSFNSDDIIVIIVVIIMVVIIVVLIIMVVIMDHIIVVIMDLIIFVTLPPGRWARRRWRRPAPMGNSSKRQLSQRLLNSPGGDKDFSCGILKYIAPPPTPILLHFHGIALMIEESNPCWDVHSVASFLEGSCLVKFHLKMPKTLKNS